MLEYSLKLLSSLDEARSGRKRRKVSRIITMILTAYFMYVVLDKLLMMLTVETRTDQTNIRIDFHMNIPVLLKWCNWVSIIIVCTPQYSISPNPSRAKISVQSKNKSFNQKHTIFCDSQRKTGAMPVSTQFHTSHDTITAVAKYVFIAFTPLVNPTWKLNENYNWQGSQNQLTFRFV